MATTHPTVVNNNSLPIVTLGNFGPIRENEEMNLSVLTLYLSFFALVLVSVTIRSNFEQSMANILVVGTGKDVFLSLETSFGHSLRKERILHQGLFC
jgi:hypothetical protein